MKIPFVMIIVLLLVYSCKDDPVKPQELPPAIYGHIEDSTGAPLANALVRIMNFSVLETTNEITDSANMVIFPYGTSNSLRVDFNIKKTSDVTLILIEETTGDTVINQGMKSLKAGNYSYQLTIVNPRDPIQDPRFGIYRVFILMETEILTKRYFFQDVHSVPEPVAMTDAKGNFVIEYNHFPVGESGMMVAEDGSILGNRVIGDSVNLAAMYGNDLGWKQTVKIEKNKEVHLKCVMKKVR